MLQAIQELFPNKQVKLMFQDSFTLQDALWIISTVIIRTQIHHWHPGKSYSIKSTFMITKEWITQWIGIHKFFSLPPTLICYPRTRIELELNYVSACLIRLWTRCLFKETMVSLSFCWFFSVMLLGHIIGWELMVNTIIIISLLDLYTIKHQLVYF